MIDMPYSVLVRTQYANLTNNTCTYRSTGIRTASVFALYTVQGKNPTNGYCNYRTDAGGEFGGWLPLAGARTQHPRRPLHMAACR